MIKKFRKKPVVVEAIKYTGTDENKIDIWNFCRGVNVYVDEKEHYVISALDGAMIANVGDYIIKDIYGEIYPCKSDIFEKIYELVED